MAITPCKNPEVCGVSNHVQGSAAEARCRLVDSIRQHYTPASIDHGGIPVSDDDEMSSAQFVVSEEVARTIAYNLSSVVGGSVNDADRFLSRTRGIMDGSEPRPDPDDPYYIQRERFLTHEDTVPTLIDDADLDQEEADHALEEIRKATDPSHPLTSDKRVEVGAKTERLRQLQQRADLLAEEIEMLKEDLREDEEIPMDTEISLDDGRMLHLKRTRVFRADLARETLTKEQQDRITVQKLDPAMARKELSAADLAKCQEKGTLRVIIR